MKEKYISLMNKTLDAYSHEHIISYFDKVKNEGLTEHGFPRLCSNIGILIAHGYRKELKDLFIEMMDFCCSQFHRGKAANDFSIKEVIFAIMALEEHSAISSDKLDDWKSKLALLDPYTCYDIYAKTPVDKVYNWACFSAVSEFMRGYIGLADTSEFVDIQIPTQLQWLDENGMYRDDPTDPPIVYDLVPRGLFAVLLHFGYSGKYRESMDEALRRAGLYTLDMQSVSGEIPFGGRSNQFLHNEAHLALISEYEAGRYMREGNTVLASRFKAAAVKATKNIETYLSKTPITHIKNRFPINSQYGCEIYAYFDKYMITAASFIYVAYLLSDDTIIPSKENYQHEPRAFTLSNDFHKIFLRAGGYAIEFDTYGDPHYDASGLGRIHKEGAPGELCLSTPCPKAPSYKISTENAIDLSFAVGAYVNKEIVFATGRDTKYELTALSSDENSARATITNTFSNNATVTSEYVLDNTGLTITVSGEDEIFYMLPAFYFNGENYPTIKEISPMLSVTYDGYTATYTTDGEILPLSGMGYNRNGYYKPYYAKGISNLKIKINIEKN